MEKLPSLKINANHAFEHVLHTDIGWFSIQRPWSLWCSCQSATHILTLLGGSNMLADNFGKSEGSSACVAERASFAGSAFSFSFSSLPLSPLLDRDRRDFFPFRPLLLPLLSSDLEDDEDEDDELESDSTLLKRFFKVSLRVVFLGFRAHTRPLARQDLS